MRLYGKKNESFLYFISQLHICCTFLFKDIISFWIDKGVAGFRFDALRHLYESDTFLDEPCLMDKCSSTRYESLNHIYTADQPETIEIIKEWRKFIDDYTKVKNISLPR